MSALAGELARLIRQDGPIGVDRYMALCLGHPVHGYYMTRDPFGARGDFTTAPEISQMFGELIGLWAGQLWLDMGAPSPVTLVEIGPGRGTLMADALRALSRAIPAFRAAARVRMVETSPALQARQQAALAGCGFDLAWTSTVEEALAGPAIVLANELLDALPMRQFVATPEGWRERLVGLAEENGERLAFGLSEVMRPGLPAAPAGTVIERSPAQERLAAGVAAHVAAEGGAALFIDYGSAVDGVGDTLQAVRAHRFVDPLLDPGEADLTTQVNFARIAAAGAAAGAAVHGPVTQGDFLRAIGLGQRAAALKLRATPEQAAEIDRAAERLASMAERGMGALFKAMAFSSPALPRLPGFDAPAPDSTQP